MSTTVNKYSPFPGEIAASTFTFKADVASSEGANNVILADEYNRLSPFKTAAQEANPKVRQSIKGKPITAFHKSGNKYTFLGKMNFNYDKGTLEVFGLNAANGDISLEFLNNTSDICLFKGFDENAWSNDLEFRCGEETSIPEIKELWDWVISCSNNPTKFKSELGDYFDVNSCLFYYLFTFIWMGVDSRAKNAFLCKDGTKQKWYWILYDADTFLGTNNEGQDVFSPYLEDTDKLSGTTDVFNGQQSVFWNLIRVAYESEIRELYQNMRSDGRIDPDELIQKFRDHQAEWPEAVFNEDAWFKYVAPLVEKGNSSYLTMLQGDKTSKREWFIPLRIAYCDSKWNAGDNVKDVITIRGYAKANPIITMFIDNYINVKFGSYETSVRANRETPTTITCPLTEVNDTEIYFKGAQWIKEIQNLHLFLVGYIDISKAVRLTKLEVGSADQNFSNPNLLDITFGNNRRLTLVDARNCTNLGKGSNGGNIDLSNCDGIQEVYFENTSITGVSFPNGGYVHTIHLPNTVTSFVLKNQKNIEDLQIADGAVITSLWLENVDGVDCDEMINNLPDNARLRYVGFAKEVTTIQEIDDFMDIWDNFRGLDENGGTTAKAQISGTFHIDSADGNELARLNERYPYVKVNADHLSAVLTYASEDGSTIYATVDVADGGDAVYSGSTPTKSSTAQYTYTFDGWSLTPGGAVSANALKNVTMNRTVYAHFNATVRTYTATFVDPAQSNRVLKTQTDIPYGTTPSAPSISGLTDGTGQPATGWSPAVAPITGNTTYSVTYKPPIPVSITDDWDTVMANIANNSYKTRYQAGDNILITLTSGDTWNAEIFAIDGDVDESGNTVPITWGPAKGDNGLMCDSHRWNPSRENDPENEGKYLEGTGTIGGWEHSELREYMRTTVYNLLPDNVKSHIVPVRKSHTAYNSSGSSFTQDTVETVFIPSKPELESGGLYYPTNDTNDNRVRKKIGSTSGNFWWLRSAYNAGSAHCVYNNGNRNYDSVSGTNGVAPCFSTR